MISPSVFDIEYKDDYDTLKRKSSIHAATPDLSVHHQEESPTVLQAHEAGYLTELSKANHFKFQNSSARQNIIGRSFFKKTESRQNSNVTEWEPESDETFLWDDDVFGRGSAVPMPRSHSSSSSRRGNDNQLRQHSTLRHSSTGNNTDWDGIQAESTLKKQDTTYRSSGSSSGLEESDTSVENWDVILDKPSIEAIKAPTEAPKESKLTEKTTDLRKSSDEEHENEKETLSVGPENSNAIHTEPKEYETLQSPEALEYQMGGHADTLSNYDRQQLTKRENSVRSFPGARQSQVSYLSVVEAGTGKRTMSSVPQSSSIASNDIPAVVQAFPEPPNQSRVSQASYLSIQRQGRPTMTLWSPEDAQIAANQDMKAGKRASEISYLSLLEDGTTVRAAPRESHVSYMSLPGDEYRPTPFARDSTVSGSGTLDRHTFRKGEKMSMIPRENPIPEAEESENQSNPISPELVSPEPAGSSVARSSLLRDERRSTGGISAEIFLDDDTVPKK
eukprot:m.345107 g.345107  ORF g.345107 m.345107 type:complete len:504 (-) comp25751_c0_seq1:45-1556(-)